MTITTKPQGHVEVENIEDYLPYQLDEMSNVLPVTTIEQLQGLGDTSVLELVNDDEPISDNDDIIESSKDDGEHDGNDFVDGDFHNSDD